MKPRIPGWVKRKALDLLIIEGMSPSQAREVVIPVPEGMLCGGRGNPKYPAKKGEKRPLGDFISLEHLKRWRNSPEVVEGRKQRDADYVAKRLVQARQLDDILMMHVKPLVQGLRPKVDELGRLKKDPSGNQLYEVVAVQSQVAAMQAALRIAERAEGPALQRVEHSGSLDIGKLSPEELEAKREALIAKAAGRVAG